MTEIPIFEPQISLPKHVKAKKMLVKGLTFALFPKSVRRSARHWLGWKLKIDNRPCSAKYKKIMEKTQEEFLRSCGNLDYNKYKIVSLGSDCMSRTLPTFWRLKPRKKEGEKSLPFDLSGNNITGMVQNLQSDFDGFFDGLEWSTVFNAYINFKRGCYYLHEDDLTNSPESLQLFKDRFTRRIEDFREVMKSDKPVIFIFHYGEQVCCSRPEEFDALYPVVKVLRGDKPWSWLVIDTTGELEHKYADLEYYTPDFLPKDYVWHTDASRFTPEGIRFERELMEKIWKLIKKYQ